MHFAIGPFSPDLSPSVGLGGVIVGLALLVGSKRVATAAIFTSVLLSGLLLVSLLLGGSPMLLAPMAAASGLLLLLVGDPGRDRRLLGAGAFIVGSVVFATASGSSDAPGGLDVGASQASVVSSSGLPQSRTIHGRAMAYRLSIPENWEEVEAGASDRRYSRRGTEAALAVKVTPIPREVLMDWAIQALGDDQAQVSYTAELPGFGDAGVIREVRRRTEDGSTTSLDAIVQTRTHWFLLLGLVNTEDFGVVETELRAILQSFTLPADQELLPRNAGAPTLGLVAGAATPYELTFPPGWHRFISDEHNVTEFDLWAYRPYRGAHFHVEVLEPDGRTDKRLIADIVANLRKEHPDLKVVTTADPPPSGRPNRTHLVIAESSGPDTQQWIEVHRTKRRVIILTASTQAAKLKLEVLAIMDSFKVSAR